MLETSDPTGKTNVVEGFYFTLLNEILEAHGQMRLVQIGAHAGNQNDPLFRFIKTTFPKFPDKCKAVLVEPIPRHFRELRATYADCPGVYFANVAIAENNEPKTIWSLRDDVDPAAHGFPPWFTQLSSFNPGRVNLLEEITPEMRDFLKQNTIPGLVRCSTFEALLESFRMEQVELIVIDVEGYELEILKTIDFETAPPQFLIFEYALFDAETKQACEKLLSENHYSQMDISGDTVCFLDFAGPVIFTPLLDDRGNGRRAERSES